MDLLLMANNAGSFLLALALFLLVRFNAWADEPFQRTITAGYAILLFLVLATVLIRNELAAVINLQWLLVFNKFVLAVTLLLVAIRLQSIHGKDDSK